MKVMYDGFRNTFHVYMNTDRQRLHKGGIEARLCALKSKGTGVRIVSCEYGVGDKKDRVFTHVTFIPITESYDTMKELCMIDADGKGLWREMSGDS